MTITITVTNHGHFTALCRVSLILDGFGEVIEENTLAPGAAYTFWLPERSIRDLQLEVKHYTSLTWAPTYATGTLTWTNPAEQIKGGEAHIELFGTPLFKYGVRWTNP